MNREQIVDAIRKLSNEDVFKNIENSCKELMDDCELKSGEIPEEIKPILRLFFIRGYRISEQKNFEILNLISQLKECDKQ